MVVKNREIASLFERLADLLELEQANPFRARAYRNAARTVTGHSRSLAGMLAQGEDLTRLPGIGRDLAGKIRQIVDTGRLPLLDQVQQRTPVALSELMHVEGLGPKRVKALHDALGVCSVADLAQAVERQQVRRLPGFGARTEDRIRRSLARHATVAGRTLLADAEQVAAPLAAFLKAVPGVDQVEVAGSFRRRKETVGDLDLLVTARRGAQVTERFVRYDEVDAVLARGRTRATVRLRSGLQVDLRVVPRVAFGAALYYFTGSKDHNVALRKRARQRGLKINEYGVFEGDRRIAGRSETEVLRSVGLPFIPPELREHRGEIEAAAEGRLPGLVETGDIRGDLHCHTDASDGRDSLARMARAAQQLGYEYLAITDHTAHVAVAHGLDGRRLQRQMDAIDRLNGRLDGLTLLKSAEVDILDDGSLDLPDELLRALDLAVCAVHTGFALPRQRQTERILRALDHPCCTILAHPRGRLLNERVPCDVDLERVLRAAAERGCIMEVNAQPARLDLDDADCRLARDLGVRLAISTDAHRAADLAFMRYGVGQGRRGWLRAQDVVNTRSLADLRSLLRRR